MKSSMINEYTRCLLDSVSFNRVTSANYQNISVLYTSFDNNKVIFNKVNKSYFVRDKKIIGFTIDETIIHEQRDSIAFDGSVDAYYDGNTKIYFKNFGKAKAIFNGFSDFYKKATEEEKIAFLSNSFLFTNKDINTFRIGERNLRKISYLINESNVDLDNPAIRAKYIDYSNKYPELGITISDGKLNFKNNKDISNILQLLDEHFYITPISNEKREVNSSKKIIH